MDTSMKQKGKQKALPGATWAAALLLLLIALLALGGLFLLVFQERSRLRLVAEFRAYQLASELLRTYDRDSVIVENRLAELGAFGIYAARGEALFRYRRAPEILDVEEALRAPQFSADYITLVREFGNMPQMRGRMRSPSLAPPAQPLRSMPGGMSRFVYISYPTAALRRGEIAIYLGGGLVALALGLAFIILIRLAQNLDSYRAEEARNRELLALGEAARTLAHEIKNPLGVLKIQCAILKKDSGESKASSVRVIEEEVERLASLTDRLRLFLAPGSGNPVSIPLDLYLDSLSDRYAARLHIEKGNSRHFSIMVDRLHLDQIMDNLIANALESMEALADGEVLVEAEGRKGIVELRVSDRGRGIPEKDTERVYDLFFTTKTSGTGLGLALSRRYAEAMGGSLSHQKREGGGTCFILSLSSKRGPFRA
ncbi:hypothetical protein MASR2M78_02800 [Treponema sp.]